MADQITKDIQSIAGRVKPDPVGLGPADEYDSIGTSRGEGVINSRGDVTGSNSEGSDDKEDQPASPVPPADNPEDNDTGGVGGTDDGSAPDGAINGDVKDVDDQITTGSQIDTVTGTDPTTSDPVDLDLNTLEDIEYDPPPGWDSPDTPPDSAEGAAWVIANNTTLFQGSGDAFLAYQVLNPTAVSYVTAAKVGFVGLAGHPRGYNFDQVGNVTFDPPQGITEVLFRANDLSEAEIETVQPDDHPSDGSCSVVFDVAAGGYKGHVRDPDCSAAQKTPSQCIIIRSVTDNSKYFQFCKLASGSVKMTEVDEFGVAIPGSTVKIIGNDGRVESFTSTSVGGDMN